MTDKEKDKKMHTAFWKDIIYKNDKIDEEQVMKELLDFSDMMHRFCIFLEEATGGQMSKLNYTTGAMIGELNNHIENCVDDALEEEREVFEADMKANLQELLEILCPKGGTPLNRGEALVAYAKYILGLFPSKTHKVGCPDCGMVDVEPDGWETKDKPISGKCPKCNEQLFFG